MVATTFDGDGGIPVGAPVYTVDGERLGYVVDGDAYQMEVGDGFLFQTTYVIELCDVECYVDGALRLKLTMDQVEDCQK